MTREQLFQDSMDNCKGNGIRVFHIKTDEDRELYRNITCDLSYEMDAEKVKEVMKQVRVKDIEHVALVATDDLETAFRQTNHIDWDWFDNTDVKTIKQSRSTSVGDVMIKDGLVYVVASCGFVHLSTLTLSLS